jgi:hypothetical protein
MKKKKILPIIASGLLVAIFLVILIFQNRSIYNQNPNVVLPNRLEWVETKEGLCLREYPWQPRNPQDKVNIVDSVSYDELNDIWKGIYDKSLETSQVDLKELELEVDGFGGEASGEYSNAITFRNLNYWEKISDKNKAIFLESLNNEILDFILENDLPFKELETFVFSCEQDLNVAIGWVGYVRSDEKSVETLKFDWK